MTLLGLLPPPRFELVPPFSDLTRASSVGHALCWRDLRGGVVLIGLLCLLFPSNRTLHAQTHTYTHVFFVFLVCVVHENGKARAMSKSPTKKPRGSPTPPRSRHEVRSAPDTIETHPSSTGTAAGTPNVGTPDTTPWTTRSTEPQWSASDWCREQAEQWPARSRLALKSCNLWASCSGPP